jgi:signal transduction histidine kinase
MLDIEMDKKALMMKITDNGCGMTQEQMHGVGKYGLLSIRERVRHFGGKISIVSHPGKGTSVALVMPFEEHAKETIL